MIKKCLRSFFRNFDYFGVVFTFKYKAEEKYRTATGGICFLLFLAMALTYGVIIGIPILRREQMSVIDYVMKTVGTDELNFSEFGSTFAVGISQCSNFKNLSEMLELFDIQMNHITYMNDGNGSYSLEKTPMEYGLCTYENFFNKLNDSFDTLLLNRVFCPVNSDFQISGVYTDKKYEYIEIAVKSRKEDEDSFKAIKKIFSDECSLSVFYIDFAFDIFNYKDPVYMFIDQQSMYLKFSEVIKMNMFFKVVQFDSYENYFFDGYNRKRLLSFSSYDMYSNYKGESRFNETPVEYDTFAKIYIRAANEKEILERRYTKMTEFAANVSSIFSAILIFMFLLVTFINKFYANESVMHRIFQFSKGFKKGSKKRNNDIRKIINKNVYLFESPDERMNCKYPF